MRFAFCFILAFGWFMAGSAARADLVVVGGHMDIGVALHGGALELHMHADTPLNLFGGGTLPADEYEHDAFVIGVPGPSVARPSGAAWDFIGNSSGEPVWFLPQASDPAKPFVGIATEELIPAHWIGGTTWTFNSISLVDGAPSEFSLFQTSFLGPDVQLSSFSGPSSFTFPVGIHDHFVWAFTEEGIYDVSLTVSGTHSLHGFLSDTKSFRFATGSFIPVAAVPEPTSTALLLAGGVAGLMRWRRRLKVKLVAERS